MRVATHRYEPSWPVMPARDSSQTTHAHADRTHTRDEGDLALAVLLDGREAECAAKGVCNVSHFVVKSFVSVQEAKATMMVKLRERKARGRAEGFVAADPRTGRGID